MGLAEISPNNPLKVIHSQLEYDENKDKVAFVGISNWTLDASKMNRGIYLSIPEPDEDDLIETALKIAESYSSSLITNYEDEIRQVVDCADGISRRVTDTGAHRKAQHHRHIHHQSQPHGAGAAIQIDDFILVFH